MIPVWAVTTVTLLYVVVLFAVAYYADLRRKSGQSIISNSYIYSLSLAVYFTSWTYYGSVGRAATSGLDFLPIYLGPTLIAFSWWFLLRKMVRISKEQNIVSIADFISSRYGKSALLGAVVTLFAVLGIMPYLALQLKAVAFTFDLLTAHTEHPTGALFALSWLPDFIDTAFVVALLLGIFGVLFGARHLDASERHEGLVAAVAVESLVKLVAFCTVGIFVTYGLFAGFPPVFPMLQSHEEIVLRDAGLEDGFRVLAESGAGLVEAIVHRRRPLYGVQFHPERSGELGVKLLANFLRMIQ